MKRNQSKLLAMIILLPLLMTSGVFWKSAVNSSNAFIELQNIGFDLFVLNDIRCLKYVRTEPCLLSMEQVPNLAALNGIDRIHVTVDAQVPKEVELLLEQKGIELRYLDAN